MSASVKKRRSNAPQTNRENDKTNTMKQTSLKVMGLDVSLWVNRNTYKLKLYSVIR